MKLGKKAQKGGSSYEIDMTNGPLLGKIIKFAIPLALSGILQLLFNAADMIVAGRFAGSDALAAVGATGALNQLILNLFMGLSIGVNVLVARYYGAGQHRDLEETVHTAILTSVICGVFLVFLGIILSRPMLELMGTPDNVIDQSVIYMRILFGGVPVMLIYNFGSAILRAVGDTRRPLYYLVIAGLVNVCLNLFFVIVLHWGVAGVATATVLSQCISSALVIRCLVKINAPYQLNLKRLRICKGKLLQMIRIGIPAGIQGCTFSISNVLIQSSINSFGSIAMAGSTAAGNLEGFVFTAMDACTQAAQCFVGQNYGARKFDRINRVLLCCMGLTTFIGVVFGGGMYLAGRPLLNIYINGTEQEVAEALTYGLTRMLTNCVPYFLCGVMNVIVGAMRGLGSSVLPMTISIFGVCVLRVVWIYTVFALNHTFFTLFVSYPVTWLITALIELPCYLMLKKRTQRSAELAAARSAAQE